MWGFPCQCIQFVASWLWTCCDTPFTTFWQSWCQAVQRNRAACTVCGVQELLLAEHKDRCPEHQKSNCRRAGSIFG